MILSSDKRGICGKVEFGELRVLETQRLMIRNFIRGDARSCFESWGEDRELGKYILPYPMQDISQMEELVEAFVANPNAWIIVNKENKNVIGYITVDIPYEALKIGEIGYVIAEKYQHQGFAYEALQCVISEYFSEKGLYMLEAKYNELNIASANLLGKIGFRIDGNLRDRRIDFTSGNHCNLIVCSITKDEFEH